MEDGAQAGVGPKQQLGRLRLLLRPEKDFLILKLFRNDLIPEIKFDPRKLTKLVQKI